MAHERFELLTGIAEYIEELQTVEQRLREVAAEADSDGFRQPIDSLDDVLEMVHKAWSGSNLGYHARLYYKDFLPPPPNDMFNKEWGMMMRSNHERSWETRDEDDVKSEIFRIAGDLDLTPLRARSDEIRAILLYSKETISSILSSYLTDRVDTYISEILEKVKATSAPNSTSFARRYLPKGKVMTRDSLAINQGFAVAPHHQVCADREAIEAPYICVRALADYAKNAAEHLRRKPSDPPLGVVAQLGSRVFIGHGASHQWRELKDYVQDRLGVPVDEFNRVPVAGFTTVARLSEMLENAAMAFLVMTAEDETPDGGYRARQNVVHEVGLFQGRLGFDKAIVMVEEGCEDFSNIHGLTQVRYPAGNISAKFHEVRALLEREGLL